MHVPSKWHLADVDDFMKDRQRERLSVLATKNRINLNWIEYDLHEGMFRALSKRTRRWHRAFQVG